MRKLVYLEEMMKRPVLMPGRLPAETLAELHATSPPIPLCLLRRSLDREVGFPVTRTNIPLPSPLLPLYQSAARLISQSLIVLRHHWNRQIRSRKYVSLKAADFVLRESELMSKEIESGCRKRNELAWLMGRWNKHPLLVDQMEHVKRAVAQIQENNDIHPLVKRYITGNICRILCKSIPTNI